MKEGRAEGGEVVQGPWVVVPHVGTSRSESVANNLKEQVDTLMVITKDL